MKLRTTARRLTPGNAILRSSLVLALLAAALLPATGCKNTKRFFARWHHTRKAKSAANTTDYADNVEDLVESDKPTLAQLRWPDFSADQPTLHQFYDDRDYELAWTRDGKPTAATTALLKLFSNAGQKGLEPEDYDASRWPGQLQKLTAILKKHDTSDDAQNAIAAFDVAVTLDSIRYLDDLHLGRINPQSLNFDIDVPARRAAFDVATLLNDHVVDASDVPSVAASVEPDNPIYRATEQSLATYRTLALEQAVAPQQPLPSLPEGAKPIVPGGTYTGLQQLVARLQFEGDAPSTLTPADSTSTTYTQDIADAVQHYQSRHGLATDGKLGQGTIDSLNVPMRARVLQLDDSLERWRWLPDNYVQPRVLANLPEFMLRTYNADHMLAFKMRVVDGEAKGNHDTPMFVRLMRYVVFRPYWNLPPSIIKREIVPHVERSGIGYLASHDYEAYKNDGTVVSATLDDLEHVRVGLRQKPGPKNSLGLVKFLFPNEYDVYMHSTPELPLFDLTRRDRSHGCVRLQHADQMALWVMSNDQPDPASQTKWDTNSIHDAMNGDNNNKTYNLKTPLPVVLAYFTAMADEDGTTHFYDDIYGYDKELEAALAKGRPYERAPAKINPKLTPGETE
jgi:murein L,D-transpeptidase YcbB/YkuD